jgi:amino acid transporter
MVDDKNFSKRPDERDEDVGDTASIDPASGVKRGLKTRHLSMMALAGIIGPGLLVGGPAAPSPAAGRRRC